MTVIPALSGTITEPFARGIERTADGQFIAIRISPEGTARYLSDPHATIKAALDDLFQPYAWPGGYPVAWFDCANGDALCGACARKEYHDKETRARFHAGRIAADVLEGNWEDHGRVACANCGRVIIAGEGEQS